MSYSGHLYKRSRPENCLMILKLHRRPIRCRQGVTLWTAPNTLRNQKRESAPPWNAGSRNCSLNTERISVKVKPKVWEKTLTIILKLSQVIESTNPEAFSEEIPEVLEKDGPRYFSTMRSIWSVKRGRSMPSTRQRPSPDTRSARKRTTSTTTS